MATKKIICDTDVMIEYLKITKLELFTYNKKDFNFINQLKLYSF